MNVSEHLPNGGNTPASRTISKAESTIWKPAGFHYPAGRYQRQLPDPAWFESYSGRNGEGDYPIPPGSSDLLGDAFIGRISVQDLTQLITILNKVYTYERT